MSFPTRTFAAMLIGGLAIVGCEKSEDGTVKAPDVKKAVDNAGAAAADAAAAAKEKAGEVASAVTEQAQKLYDQVKQYIDEKKFDDATKAFSSLEALKSKLPADWAAKIDELKTMLDKAKAAVGGAVPGQ